MAEEERWADDITVVPLFGAFQKEDIAVHTREIVAYYHNPPHIYCHFSLCISGNFDIIYHILVTAVSWVEQSSGIFVFVSKRNIAIFLLSVYLTGSNKDTMGLIY